MQTAPAIDLSTIPAAQRAAVLALMETVAALTEGDIGFGKLRSRQCCHQLGGNIARIDATLREKGGDGGILVHRKPHVRRRFGQ